MLNKTSVKTHHVKMEIFRTETTLPAEMFG